MVDKKKPPKRKAEPKDVLTIKRRKFLEVYIETGNATEAAFQAYDCKDRKSAKAVGGELLSKLNKGALKDRMDQAGLTDELLFRKLHEGLDAEKVEIAKFQGEIMDEKTFIDLPTRKSYLDTTLKLKGHLKDRLVVENIPHEDFTGDNAEDFIENAISEDKG